MEPALNENSADANIGGSMELSIIIVNWNSKDYLAKCLETVIANTSGIEYEIVVIDSGSFDGCGEMLQERYPQVRFVQSPDNLGFAKANNLGFTHSMGEVVLLLNPDTELVGPAINQTFDFLKARPEAGIVGCRLLNSDRSIQITATRAFPTLLNQVLESNLLRRLFPRSALWGAGPLLSNAGEAVPVEAVSGAFMMVRRSVFERIGKLSTDYFMYSEDIDLCLKSRKAGFVNYHLGNAVVIHFGGGSSGRTSVSKFSSVMMFESRWRFFLNTRSLWYAVAYRVLVLCSSLTRVFLSTACWCASALVGRSQRWKLAVQKWWALFRWSLGFEGWVRKY